MRVGFWWIPLNPWAPYHASSCNASGQRLGKVSLFGKVLVKHHTLGDGALEICTRHTKSKTAYFLLYLYDKENKHRGVKIRH